MSTVTYAFVCAVIHHSVLQVELRLTSSMCAYWKANVWLCRVWATRHLWCILVKSRICQHVIFMRMSKFTRVG